MTANGLSSQDFWVGDWFVRPRLGRIQRGDETVHIAPRAMAVLVRLAEADGAVVSRNELLDAVWPRMDVTQDALSQTIVELRKAFADNAKNPRVIETIPKLGLRLVTPVVAAAARSPGRHTETIAHEAPRVTAAPRPDPSTDRDAGLRPAGLRSMAAWGLVAVLVVVLVLGTVAVRWNAPDERSIAVLPFALDSMVDGETASFADGLHDELLTQLARMSGFDKVIARGAVMRYRDSDASIREIGQALDVDAVLEVTLRREGDRVRLVATLADVETEATLWRSEPYDRALTTEGLFSLEIELALSIASALEAAITDEELAALRKVPTRNPEALAFYQSGKEYFRRSSNREEDLRWSLVQYQRATEHDPTFAEAWARLGIVHTALYWLGFDPAPERLAAARAAIDRAFEFGPNLGETHLAQANYLNRAQGERDAALAEFAVAERLIPHDSELYLHRASVYRRLGHWEKATQDLARALEIDPDNLWYRRQQHISGLYLRDYALSERQLDAIDDAHPDDPVVYVSRVALGLFRNGATALAHEYDRAPPTPDYELGTNYVYTRWLAAIFDQEYETALGILQAIDQDRDAMPANESTRLLSLLYAHTYRLAGDHERAQAHYREALRAMEARWTQHDALRPAEAYAGLGQIPLRDLAEAYAGLGQRDEALVAIEQALDSARQSHDAVNESTIKLDLVLGVLLPLADQDEALRDRAFEALDDYLDGAGIWSIEGLESDPRLDPIKNDPRFHALVAKHTRS